MLGWYLDLLGLLYYSTVGRKAISRGGKLLATHAHIFYAYKVFYCAKVINSQSASVIFSFGRFTATYYVQEV